MWETGTFEKKTVNWKTLQNNNFVENLCIISRFSIIGNKKRVDFKIRKKTANKKTGRFEVETANDNFSDEKKTAKKKPMKVNGRKKKPDYQEKIETWIFVH